MFMFQHSDDVQKYFTNEPFVIDFERFLPEQKLLSVRLRAVFFTIQLPVLILGIIDPHLILKIFFNDLELYWSCSNINYLSMHDCSCGRVLLYEILIYI